MIILVLFGIGAAIVIITVIIGAIAGIIESFKMLCNGTLLEKNTDTIEEEKPDINEIERLQRYSQQVDGYTQAIKLLDIVYKEESDPKKKAAVLSKQLVLIDKLDRTIAKLEKLDN